MENTTQPEVETVTQPEATIKVKYNKEEREIPVSEAAVLAQKGMNYDKVMSKLQEYEEQLKGYKQKESQAELNTKIKQLTESGLDEAIAKRLVESESKSTITEQELNQLRAQVFADNQVRTFATERPDVDLSKIPADVIEAARKSGNLLKEYNAWESGLLRTKIAELEKELGVKKVNDDNSASSMGSAESKGSTAPTEITEETIKKMTSEQRRKQLSDKNSPLYKFMFGG